MNKSLRVAALAGAASVGLAVAPAFAADASDRASEKASTAAQTKKSAKETKARKIARWDRCEIADDLLLSGGDHAGLARFAARVEALVAKGRISEARGERLVERRAKQVTVQKALNSARWTPIYELFGVEDRKGLRVAIREAGGMRELRRKKGISVRDLRLARRTGIADMRGIRAELCRSGKDEAPEASGPSAP